MVLTFKELVEKLMNNEEIMVLTHNFNKNIDEYVLATNPLMNNGLKKWVEIELENGDIVHCTEDHEIFTNNRGYVPAKDLTINDDIKEMIK